jgi:hypothetical protein
MGGCNDADIRLEGLVAPHAVVLAIGENSQQPSLQVERHIPDLIEKERAALSLFKAPASLGLSTRKGAALVPKQLRLQQIFGDRSCIERNKRAIRTRAVSV